ncbi:hypothetical protein LX36DRAFT_663540 [Colletotrichum falcatum]|nr:hypothetical protein LX36DRAFT_663540 [Colletotrichum falcatum]
MSIVCWGRRVGRERDRELTQGSSRRKEEEEEEERTASKEKETGTTKPSEKNCTERDDSFTGLGSKLEKKEREKMVGGVLGNVM